MWDFFQKRINNFIKWLPTRRPVVFSTFIFLLLAACFVFCLGVENLPNIQSSISPKIGEVNFEIDNYDFQKNDANSFYARCEISSDQFAVRNPINIEVRLYVSRSVKYYEVPSIYVSFHNAKTYPPIFLFTTGTLKDCQFSLNYSHTTDLYDVWIGEDTATIETTGPIEMDVKVFRTPKNDYTNLINSNTFRYQVIEELTFETLNIESLKSIQEEYIENWNFSSSFFILFFAIAEIAIEFYNHSEDREKMEEYERKRNKEHKLNTNYPDKELAY